MKTFAQGFVALRSILATWQPCVEGGNGRFEPSQEWEVGADRSLARIAHFE